MLGKVRGFGSTLLFFVSPGAGCMTQQAVSCLKSCQSQFFSCALILSTAWSQAWGKVWTPGVHSVDFMGAWNVLGKEGLKFVTDTQRMLWFGSKHTMIWRPSKSAWFSYSCIWYVEFGFCFASRCFWELDGNLSMDKANTVRRWENNSIQTEGWVIFELLSSIFWVIIEFWLV